MLFIVTSTGHRLFSFINVDDFERSRTTTCYLSQQALATGFLNLLTSMTLNLER